MALILLPESREYIDEEFCWYLEIARSLLIALDHPEYRRIREISAEYIRRCITLETHFPEIKARRNSFFRYFLKLLEGAVESQPTQDFTLVKTPLRKTDFESSETDEDSKFSWFMSEDRKIYSAHKHLDGIGTLIYLAASYKPELGWIPNGIQKGLEECIVEQS